MAKKAAIGKNAWGLLTEMRRRRCSAHWQKRLISWLLQSPF